MPRKNKFIAHSRDRDRHLDRHTLEAVAPLVGLSDQEQRVGPVERPMGRIDLLVQDTWLARCTRCGTRPAGGDEREILDGFGFTEQAVEQ
jgi:hypothetical protein